MFTSVSICGVRVLAVPVPVDVLQAVVLALHTLPHFQHELLAFNFLDHFCFLLSKLNFVENSATFSRSLL